VVAAAEHRAAVAAVDSGAAGLRVAVEPAGARAAAELRVASKEASQEESKEEFRLEVAREQERLPDPGADRQARPHHPGRGRMARRFRRRSFLIHGKLSGRGAELSEKAIRRW